MYCEFLNAYNRAVTLQTDLKTIKGYKNRAEKMNPKPVQLKIYYCGDSKGYYSSQTKTKYVNL